MQFYNNGDAYTTCDTLLTLDHFQGGTSLGEIASKANIDIQKLVIGKPLRGEDAPAKGWIDPAVMSTCYNPEKSGGLMFWQWVPGSTLAVDTLKTIIG